MGYDLLAGIIPYSVRHVKGYRVGKTLPTLIHTSNI